MVLVRGPAMFLAVKTTASTAGIWAIVIVAVIWLVMVVGIAPRPAARLRHGRHALPGPLAGGYQVPAVGEPATSADSPDTVTGTPEPGVQWTARTPAQRESATDRAVPHRDHDTGR